MQKQIAEEDEFLAYRASYQPKVPKLLRGSELVAQTKPVDAVEGIKSLFPSLTKQGINYVSFAEKQANPDEIKAALRIGVVLSGGQAAGGHNVIVGIYDHIKRIHKNSQLFGFLNGPHGVYSGEYREIRKDTIKYFRNRGGFDMICSGRHKIETPEQFQNAKKHCEALKLDGLIVIGGDDSNTNASLLAEYFLANNCSTKVVGCPKTIDGDLKNEFIEVSFGFDTACKTYSECIGNITLDTISSKKYYHFVRLMGRSASHITLECALLTRPTAALIGEEIEAKNKKLHDIVNELADIVVARSQEKKDYGVILLPEGLVEFIQEINLLIKEINELLSKHADKPTELDHLFGFVSEKLTSDSQKLFVFLPRAISEQLLLDRDPHGNVQVSKIETEKLLILLLSSELEARKAAGKYEGQFSSLAHFFGYEGRCAFPTNFDCDYCYSLGVNAAALIEGGFTGLMSVIRNLDQDPENWIAGGCPLITMMNIERRKGKDVPVIKKALVELDGPLFKVFEKERSKWATTNHFQPPGPVQFEFASRCPFLVKEPSDQELYFNQDKNYNKESQPFSRIFPSGNMSSLAFARSKQAPQLIQVLQDGEYEVVLSGGLNYSSSETKSLAEKEFPSLLNDVGAHNPRSIEIVSKSSIKGSLSTVVKVQHQSPKIGVLFCGRQFPGGHNILSGLLEFANRTKGELYGFIGGTKGLFKNNHIKIDSDSLELYVNQGGLHYLGRSSDKIRSDKELESTLKTCEALGLDGLVLIGASHTLSDAVHVTDYLLSKNSKTRVITVPGSLDGNVGHHMLEAIVGFDSASKVYSQLIGNIMVDAASAVKYWYFIRLMGRDPSHLVMEAALQTQPNMVLISEEISEQGKALNDVVSDIADLICERAEQDKNYGTILIPEGLVNHLPHCKALINELNEQFSSAKSKEQQTDLQDKLLRDEEYVKKILTPWSAATFLSFPDFTRIQLVLERETHGTTQLSQIETERLLAHLVGIEMKKRKDKKAYKGSFSPITHYFGYQGRCSMPSIFDCNLAHNFGFIAGVLIEHGLTGYSVTARGLTNAVKEWHAGGIPLLSMLHAKTKSAYGDNRAIVPSYEVNLRKAPFLELKAKRNIWRNNESFINPGPLQFFGPMAERLNQTLVLANQGYPAALRKIEELTEAIKSQCRFGTHEDTLKVAIMNLENLQGMLQIFKANTLE